MKQTLTSMLEQRWFNTGHTFASEHIYHHPDIKDKFWLYNPRTQVGYMFDMPEVNMSHKRLFSDEYKHKSGDAQ